MLQQAMDFNSAPIVRRFDESSSSSTTTTTSSISSINAAPLFTIDNDGSVILEAVKMAETNNNNGGDATTSTTSTTSTSTQQQIVVRLYEAYGGRGRRRVTWHESLRFRRVESCDLLEQPVDVAGDDIVFDADARSVQLSFAPFQIRTLKFSF